jgi:hypothetical protein
MNRLLLKFFDQLSGLPRGTDETELLELLARWRHGAEMAHIRRAIYQWMSDSAALDYLRTWARETSTHYVWPLYITNSGYGIVINEFKDPRQMAVGYANTTHNHRYSFASLVLSGGYRQVRSNVEISGLGQSAHVYDIDQDDILEGRMLTISHEEFHRITDVQRRTMTLLVKCPAVKEASISVDVATRRASRHVPVEARVTQLMNALVMTEDAGMAEGKSDARLA